MELSLVICTRNRSEYLSACLKSLEGLISGPKWELVLVNNGSTDDTEAVLERFRQQFHHPVTIVNEPVPGLGRARNSGWKQAVGTVIAFTDDDCYPGPYYLLRMLECFNDNVISFIGGRILLHDPEDLPMTIQTLTHRVALEPGSFLPAGFIQGANMAIRKAALEAVNGFDERMGPGTPFPCEDVDILARLLRHGLRGAYDPRPTVFHHHRRKGLAAAEKLMETYDYGRGAYYAKCMTDPALRELYASNWKRLAQTNREQSLRTEVLGALHFFCDHCQPAE